MALVEVCGRTWAPSGAAGTEGAVLADGEVRDSEFAEAAAVAGSLGQVGVPSED